MDLQLEQLESVTLADVLRESVSIPRSSPRTFALITLTLVFPLSFAVLAHTLFTHPILRHLHSSSSSSGEWLLLLVLYQFIYLLFLFTFSLLSTAAVVFTVASLYAAKPVSFRSTLVAIRPILPRLLRTFLWVALIMLLYNLAFALSILILLASTPSVDSSSFILGLALVLLSFLAAHVYISAVWHLASVVSVLEPLCGLAAMTKSRDLLRGRARMAAAFVTTYLGFCGLIGWAFRAVVVKGLEEGFEGFDADDDSHLLPSSPHLPLLLLLLPLPRVPPRPPSPLRTLPSQALLHPPSRFGLRGRPLIGRNPASEKNWGEEAVYRE